MYMYTQYDYHRVAGLPCSLVSLNLKLKRKKYKYKKPSKQYLKKINSMVVQRKLQDKIY